MVFCLCESSRGQRNITRRFVQQKSIFFCLIGVGVLWVSAVMGVRAFVGGEGQSDGLSGSRNGVRCLVGGLEGSVSSYVERVRLEMCGNGLCASSCQSCFGACSGLVLSLAALEQMGGNGAFSRV